MRKGDISTNIATELAEKQVPLILVVDDNEDMNNLIRDILQPNYRTEQAFDGLQGMEKARSLKPDLILSDLMMPRMSGDQFFRALKENPDLRSIPFVAISAKSDDQLRVQLLREGLDDYLTKPFISQELTARVRNLLAVRQELRARQKAEAAAKDSEAKLRGTLENSYSAIVTINQLGVIEYANPQVKTWLGYEPIELLGQPMDVLIPERYRTSHRQLHSGYARQPVCRTMGQRRELVALRKNGTEFPADISLAPYRSVDGLVITAFIRDISEERRFADQEAFLLEASRKQSEKLGYHDRLQVTADAAVPTLADFCAIYIAEKDRLVPKVIAHALNLSRELVWDAVNAHLRQKTDLPTGPMQVFRTGAAQWIENFSEIASTHLPDSAEYEPFKKLKFNSYIAVPMIARGRPLGVITFARLAPRQYSEKDLAFAEIVANRSALTLDNARLFEEAQRSIRLREEILGIVSHDLKNPLSSLLMAQEMLEEALIDAHAPQSPAVRQSVQIIGRSASQMRRLINDLFDLARIESGQLSVVPQLNSADTFIRNGLQMVRHHALKKSIDIQAQIPSNLPRLSYDLDRITQVFYNLVGNAIKFSPPSSKVEIAARVLDDELEIQVRDQGPGISPDNLEQVFEKYWQTDKSKKIGAGLGLFIAKNIVEAHHGKIRCESDGESGATFSFTLPLAQPGNQTKEQL